MCAENSGYQQLLFVVQLIESDLRRFLVTGFVPGVGRRHYKPQSDE
jgi:hypothetical protein